MGQSIPRDTDTVIIGNGPAALILSYILHGNIPYYDGGHPDALLDTKLSKNPNLLDLNPQLYEHFTSSLRYSTQALPINTFLDTLLRPNADTELNPPSCVRWKHEKNKAVPHVILGNTSAPGGQWQSNPVSASWDIGTLSYAEMLSLPGYTFAEHWEQTNREPMPDFVRPSRKQVADYLKAYPVAVRISDAIFNSEHVSDVCRTRDGFYIGSHQMRCKHLVLGSGTFSLNIPPQAPVSQLVDLRSENDPLLVVGSGFSAADAMISANESRKILHIFKWAPDIRPSPLKGCHHQAYPEYASIYKQMKLACKRLESSSINARPMVRRKSKSFFGNRDWASTYEGFPNACIKDVTVDGKISTVKIQFANGEIVERSVGDLQYVVGRRGSLGYLKPALMHEVIGDLGNNDEPATVSTRTLRPKAEKSLEVAPGVFIIGSLAGDSLIRHTFGTCVYSASKIMEDNSPSFDRRHSVQAVSSRAHKTRTPQAFTTKSIPNGLSSSNCSEQNSPTESSDSETGPDHRDLHIDRRTLPKAKSKSRPDSPTRPGALRCSSW